MYCGNEHLRWLKVSKALSTAPAAPENDFEAITVVKLFVHGWSDMHVNYTYNAWLAEAMRIFLKK